jgi:hypothetical protein
MNNLKKYTYQLKTLSKVILSPRQQQAFYRGIDFKNEEQKIKDNINVIYPFYQRGEYTRYQRENQYYIPGSSIKGALLANEEGTPHPKLFVDDLPLNAQNIVLSQLNKLQNTGENERQLKLGIFFPNVGIEMCEAGIELTNKGVLFSKKSPESYFEKEHERTKKMIKKWLQSLDELCDLNEIEEDTKSDLLQTIYNLNLIQNQQKLNENTYLMILGGYKGLLLSKVYKLKEEAPQNGFFIDRDTYLPYGLVEISKVGKSK